MAFDFDKALNGEPIYCQEEQLFNISYFPHKQGWKREGCDLWGWNKDGTPLSNGGEHHPLSTDPPKKKVKKTLYMNWYGDGERPWCHFTEIQADQHASKNHPRFQRIVIEIEVYE